VRRSPGAVIVLSAILIAGVEIGFHWLLSRSPSSTLTAIYLPSNYRTSRDDFAGLVDNLLPAAILGLATGWVAFPRWSLVRLLWVSVGVAAFVAALEPLYWALIGWNHYRGVREPANLHEALALFPWFDFCTAYIPCLLFANMTYRGRRELARRKPMNFPK
jgi:hypothetical protein